jgi:hypothetical protein
VPTEAHRSVLDARHVRELFVARRLIGEPLPVAHLVDDDHEDVGPVRPNRGRCGGRGAGQRAGAGDCQSGPADPAQRGAA